MLFIWLAVPVGFVALGQDTGWQSPSRNQGSFLYPERAYVQDYSAAWAEDGATHQYWGFNFSFPGDLSGTRIVGIEVLFLGRKRLGSVSQLAVELSWDRGISWTATGYAAEWRTGGWQQVILGGGSDLWGHPWRPTELNPEDFRVRLSARGETLLDWVAVRVHYRYEGLSLTVQPVVVDLGTLTLEDYDRGFRDYKGLQRITIRSGANWVLSCAADEAWWSYQGPGAAAKPAADLLVRVVAWGPEVVWAQSTFVGLDIVPQALARGQPERTAGGIWLDLAFRLRVDYETTPPGNYQLNLTYTLTAL